MRLSPGGMNNTFQRCRCIAFDEWLFFFLFSIKHIFAWRNFIQQRLPIISPLWSVHLLLFTPGLNPVSRFPLSAPYYAPHHDFQSLSCLSDLPLYHTSHKCPPNRPRSEWLNKQFIEYPMF